MQMKCQLTQHKSVEESGLDIGLDSDSTQTETQRPVVRRVGSPFGVIIALVPQNVCEQMIYNICHETKLNFAFALTPFNGGGWVTHTHRQTRQSQSTMQQHDAAAVVTVQGGRGGRTYQHGMQIDAIHVVPFDFVQVVQLGTGRGHALELLMQLRDACFQLAALIGQQAKLRNVTLRMASWIVVPQFGCKVNDIQHCGCSPLALLYLHCTTNAPSSAASSKATGRRPWSTSCLTCRKS